LYNKAAASLLNLPVHFDIRDQLNFVNYGLLYKSLRNWIGSPHIRPLPVQLEEGGPEVQLNFAKLENPGNDLVLVFAEDTRHMSQRAQQLKLASLGHLTASIAHEVRNPLGAISHAAQLLSESETLLEADKRLAAIIQNHTMRVNTIIENVLQLSRRQAANPDRQDLCAWLRRFAQQHAQSYKDPVNIELDVPDFPVMVYVDFSQMEQVLNNLCSNGLRYSEQATGRMDILLKVYLHNSLANPCLEVIDYGHGISEEDKQHIFEPFFTTDKKGTGLGLYIARELCLANQASLDYKKTMEGLSCFQISFSHSNKMMA
jgi:two-component system sensor histidine kinase PilS (NtrC family)